MNKKQYLCSAKCHIHIITSNNIHTMRRNFLPNFIGISMTKGQFCFATGCTPYKLKQIIRKNAKKYQQLGLSTYDKLLMPAVVRELCADTGLRVDVDYFTQYVAGQRGVTSPTE